MKLTKTKYAGTPLALNKIYFAEFGEDRLAISVKRNLLVVGGKMNPRCVRAGWIMKDIAEECEDCVLIIYKGIYKIFDDEKGD